MNKMKGVKRLSKKLWATLVSVTLGVLIAVGGAIAGVTLSLKKGGVGGNVADAAAAGNMTGSGTAAQPYVIKTSAHWAQLINICLADTKANNPGWTDAWLHSTAVTEGTTTTYILKEPEITTKKVYATLGDNLVATPNTLYGTSFGISENDNLDGTYVYEGTEPFFYGALCVPKGVNLVLDLTTYKIDRALQTASEYGSVIFDFGELEIKGQAQLNDLNGDRPSENMFRKVTGVSASGGLITGGWSHKALVGGAISVGFRKANVLIGTTKAIGYKSGKLTVSSGGIFNNRAGLDTDYTETSTGYSATVNMEQTGPGVQVNAFSNFVFNGGFISLNSGDGFSVDGGGINVVTSASLLMNGGDVSWNSVLGTGASWGGGIATRATSEIRGGTVRHNMAVGRGGAMAPHAEELIVENCKIENNIGGAEAAIYLGHTGGTGRLALSLINVTIENNLSLNNTAFMPTGANAIYMSSTKSDLTIGGKVVIRGNQRLPRADDGVRGDKVDENININGTRDAISFKLKYDETTDTGDIINISSKITDDSFIYVEMDHAGTFTKGFTENSFGTNVSVFRSSLANYVVGLNADGELEMRVATPADTWENAVNDSLRAGASVVFSLAGDMNAAEGSFGYGVGFGTTNDTVSSTGALRVPAGASLRVNLGSNDIDRGLLSSIDDGYVIIVYGTLEISGTGKITGGKNNGNGGGIYVAEGGTLILNGSIIADNQSEYGGGVYVGTSGSLNITGTELFIQNNYASIDGGGIYVSENANGIGMSGSPIINNNKSRSNFDDNLFLAGDNKIHVTGEIATGNSDDYIGIMLESGLGVFTSNPSEYAVAAGRFRSDNDIQCMIGTQGFEVAIVPNTIYSIREQWARTIQKSLDHGGASVRFSLIENWYAEGGSLGTGVGFIDGALYVPNGAAVNLSLANGATINRGINGSAAVANGSVIIVANGGALVVQGNGKITGGNTTGNGGGILVENGGTLSLRGGTITGNKADGQGGGVYANTLTLAGATITGNAASNGGGLYATTVTLGANTTITGNKDTNNKDNNLYVSNRINVSSVSGNKIGISKASAGIFTNGLKAENLAGVTDVFSADNDEQVLAVVNGEGYIGTKVKEPETDFTTLVYDKKSHAYVADKAAVEALLGSGSGKAYTVEVKRYKDAEDTEGEVVSLSDPLAITAAGRYEITFTLNTGYLWASAENRGEDSITLEVEITKASVTITRDPTISGNVYVGESIESVQKKVSAGFADCGSTGESNIPGKWTVSSASGVIDRGTTQVAYTFTPDDESIAEYTGYIAKEPVGFAITITETSAADGSATSNVKSINVDYLSNVKVRFGYEGATQYAYFEVVQDGQVVTERMGISDGKGYDAYLYLTLDAEKTPLTESDTRLQNINGNRSFSIGYAPREDTPYTIYYMIPNGEGKYQAYNSRNDLDLFAGGALVKRYGNAEGGTGAETPTGKTTGRVELVNSADDTPLIEFSNSEQYVIDWALTGAGANATIAGDGSTWVVVYLKGREYTITFEPNGAKQVYDEDGNAISFTYKAEYGSGITPPVRDEQMEMEGSTFRGWYTENNGGGTKIEDFSTQTVNGDKKYYAYWEITSYSITYHYRDPRHTAYDYDVVNDAMTGGVDAIHFTYTDAQGTEQDAYFEITGAANRESYKKTDANFSLASPSAPGFKFEGWYDANGRKVMTITRGSTGDKEFYARWTPSKYIVTFNGNGGTVSPTTKTYTNMTAYGTMPVASRAGYEFAGWYTEAQADGESVDDLDAAYKVESSMKANLSGPITLYAGWVQRTYRVTYNGSDMGGDEYGQLKLYVVAEDGTEEEASVGDALPYGTKIKLTVEPTSGYSVKSIKVGNVTIVNNVVRTLLADIDVEVKYEEQTYTIRYTYNYGSAINGESSFVKSFSLNSGNVDLPDGDDVARVGYTFANWKFSSGISDTGVSNTDQIKNLLTSSHEPLRNVTLIATWNAKPLHVFLHKQITENDDVDMTPGTLEEAVRVKTDVRNNYVLIGWATKPNSRTIAVNVDTDPESANYGTALYTLKAEDYTGSDWSQSINNLYAVWHIEGSQELLLESDATDATYTGSEYTITATPMFDYVVDRTIVLQYQWYKDGVPLTDGRITRTYEDSQKLGADWTTVEWKVKNVSESGVYECRLTATGNIGGSTYSTGSGEIEINIGKAEYTNYTLPSGRTAESGYNGQTQHAYVKYNVTENGETKAVDAQNYIQIGSNRNDWIAVRYSAVDAEGNAVAAMKNAGVYTVTAQFTVPTDSNYLPIEAQTYTYEITAVRITNLDFTIVSVGADGTETEVRDDSGALSYINAYNKQEYKVKATSAEIFAGDEVEIVLSNAANTNIGNYEAGITGELLGADAGNYVLDVIIGSTQIYSIVKADHDISNVRFDETVTVTYDGKLHEAYLEIDGKKIAEGETFKDKNGFELTVNYTVSYQENHSGYTNEGTTKNGGYAAGEYVITATFTDGDGANFNELEERICTLTVEQRDLFDEYDKEKLLGDFQTTSLSYDPDAAAKLFINGADGDMDLNSGLFRIEYVYEKLAGTTYSEIITGDEAAIRGDATFKGLRDSGYYRITAKISYNVSGTEAGGLALANNYKEIEDIVIDYTIANGVVDRISVTLKDGGEYWYGEEFDKKNIERIVVTYKGTNADGSVNEQAATTTETFTDENWLSGSIIYEGKTGENVLVAFNHVGEYTVRINFLGAEQECKVSVKQKIAEVTEWQYSKDGDEWNTLPEDGIEYEAGGYRYRAVFSGAGTEAGRIISDLKTEANVSGRTADYDTHNYVLNASETPYELYATDSGYYVLTDNGANVTGELIIKKNTQKTAQWYYGSTKIEEATIVYTGADFQNSITVRYDLGNGEQTLEWTKQEVMHAGKYTLKAPQLQAVQGGNNYELQGIEIEVTVAAKEVAYVSEAGYGWQYWDGEAWVELPASLEYKGGEYRIRILAKDGVKDVEIAVVGAPLSGGDDVAVRNAGNYRLRGANSDYTIPASQNSKDLIIQKKALTVTWKYGEEDEQFVYDGKEQTLLGAVKGVGDDASEEIVEISGNTGTKAIDYIAKATLVGDYGDNYTLVNNGEHNWKIEKRNIELTWDSVEFGYTGSVQVPEITETNVVEGEEIAIQVNYKRTIAYGVKEDVEVINVVNVGEYTAVPTFDGAAEVLSNYSFKDVECVFNIIKSAPAITSVTYREYLTNVTYQVEAGEERGLREDKLEATFNGTPVAGHFVFVDGDGNVLDGKSVDLTATSSGTKFGYRYIPDDAENYNSYEGEIEIMIVADGVMTGEDAILIDLRVKQYIVGSKLNFVGTHVWLKYASYYEENGVRHGKLAELQLSEVDFLVDGYSGTVDNFTVRPQDVPETGFGTMTLQAILKGGSKPSGYETQTFEGKTNFIVTKDEPIGMEVDEANSDFKRVWYVDEVFSTEGLRFKLDYGAGKQPGEMTAESVTCELNGTKLTEAKESLEVEFKFLDVATKITIEVREREYLQVNYSKNNNLLAYEDGKELDWKSEYGITFSEDGEDKTEIAGVEYSYIIKKRGSNNALVQVSAIDEIGVYQIEVQFIINNPRYYSFVQSPVEFTVEVSELVYKMDENFTAFTQEELNVSYKGEAYAFNTTTKPTVYDKNGNAVNPSNVRVTYSYNGETDSTKWNITEVGTYEIVLTVEVNDAKLGWRALNPITYTVTVSRAETEIKAFTIGQKDSKGNYYLMEGVSAEDVERAVSIDATFGTPTSYRYRPIGGTWTNGLPTAVGKYEVEVTIIGNDNYTTANSTTQQINAIFEIRRESVTGEDGNGNKVEIIGGANGIETGVDLDVKKLAEEELAEIKVKKQVVVGGYDVNLVLNGETVTANGEVTVRVKLGDEYAERTNLNVYLYEDGKATKLEATVDEEGYLVFTTEALGRIVITEAAVTTPAGLIAGVSIGAVVAAGLIVACVLVFLKKRGE